LSECPVYISNDTVDPILHLLIVLSADADMKDPSGISTRAITALVCPVYSSDDVLAPILHLVILPSRNPESNDPSGKTVGAFEASSYFSGDSVVPTFHLKIGPFWDPDRKDPSGKTVSDSGIVKAIISTNRLYVSYDWESYCSRVVYESGDSFAR
jgi:hypothetical protein